MSWYQRYLGRVDFYRNEVIRYQAYLNQVVEERREINTTEEIVKEEGEVLLAQKFPHLQGNTIAEILFKSATDLGEQGVDDVYGHGMLNIEAAMRPIGELNIPTGNSVEGTKTPLNQSYVTATGDIGYALANSTALQSAVVLDEYERRYSIDMTQAVMPIEPTFSFDHYRTTTHKQWIVGLSEIDAANGEAPNLILGYQPTAKTQILFGREEGIFGSIGEGVLSLGENTGVKHRGQV